MILYTKNMIEMMIHILEATLSDTYMAVDTKWGLFMLMEESRIIFPD